MLDGSMQRKFHGAVQMMQTSMCLPAQCPVPQLDRKFGVSGASDYEGRIRISLAGYDACHSLAACILSAVLDPASSARVLVVGAGGGGSEIIAAGTAAPLWTFTAVDPSAPMVDVTVERVHEAGMGARTEFSVGYLGDLAQGPAYAAAMMMGVIHHLIGDDAKMSMLRAVADRLEPGGYLVLAGNYQAYDSQPLLLAAWRQRLILQGMPACEVDAVLSEILADADPLHSESHLTELLAAVGFEAPVRFFSSLFWGAWIVRKAV
jgi:tRNA (cmo5U34)-methyltransferase